MVPLKKGDGTSRAGSAERPDRDEMLAAAVLVAVAMCPKVVGQGAQMAGGRPPLAVEQELCAIGDVFGKLSMIKADPSCTAGCAQGTGVCPADWFPGAQ